MNIIIAGNGFVGKAHQQVLQYNHTVNVIDPVLGPTRIYDYDDTQAVIVCVSTPQAEDGSCNTQNVADVIRDTDPSIPILIKSTISLEGWRELMLEFPEHRITFSPEFLRAESASEDFKNTSHLYLSNNSNYQFWYNIFSEIFTGLQTSIRDPEALILGKYFRNAFLATKVSFFNQIYDLCERTGVDYSDVRSIVGSDERIGNSHTRVTTDRGYGGHCFPKDCNAILKTAESFDVALELIETSIAYNKRIRK